ncbi:MAG: thiol:disulfide interchange protein DsbA/DsbL [Granulosicoccaceae bacterium]
MKSLFISLSLFMLLSLQSVHAANLGYEEIASPAQQPENRSTVEVTEYFWFGCPHCYAFEPSINNWDETKAEGVTLVREAPPLNNSWLPQSQAFYAAEIMGVSDIIFEPLFAAIHKGNRRLRKPKHLVKFVGELGVDMELFEKTMNSFAVDVRIKRSLNQARATGITGVPTVVIDGKYKTSGSIAGSHENAIRVIDALSRQQLNIRNQK